MTPMTMLDVEALAVLTRADWHPAPAAERRAVGVAIEFLWRVNRPSAACPRMR